MRPTLRHGVTVAATAATIAAGLAGCSLAHTMTAKEQLDSALDNLSTSHATALTFSLDATPAQLRALGSGDSPMPPAVAELVAGASLEVDASGADLSAGALSRTNLSVAATVDGHQPVQLRLVDGAVYARVDVAGIAALAEKVKPGSAAQVNGAVKMVDSGMMPQALSFLSAAAHGQWVTVDAAQAAPLLARLDKAQASNRAKAEKERAGILAVLRHDVSIRDAGQDGAGEHLVLTAPARTVAADLARQLGPLAGVNAAKVDKVPNVNASVDVWVSDGHLKAAEVDLGQFATGKDAGQHLKLKVSVNDHAAPVTAPAGSAARVDLKAVAALFGDQMMHAMPGLTATDGSASHLG